MRKKMLPSFCVGMLLIVAVPIIAEQEIYLGREQDACSGQLSVRDRNGTYVPITRGRQTVLDVAINGQGYWAWKCGSSSERSVVPQIC